MTDYTYHMHESGTVRNDTLWRWNIAYACLFSSDGTEIARQWISRDFEGGDALEMTWAFGDPKPPKPDEPMGWLALVKDGDEQWYRDALDPDYPWRMRDSRLCYEWADFPDTVQVVSEGVADR